MRSTARAIVFIVGAAGIAGACQRAPEPAVEPAGKRVENPQLGLAIASLPAPFEVLSAEGPAWTFEAPGDAGAGRLALSVGPVESGSINLVEAVKERRAEFEAAEGGSYLGNRELGGPFGTIYTARGTYAGPNGPLEETWAYAIHPGEYRLLTVRYTYPTGESGTRVEQLMEFLGEIEALGSS